MGFPSGSAPPPATNTNPLPSKVAVCCERAVVKLPVVVNVPFVGLYSSALAEAKLEVTTPPAISTRPFGSKVAVWATRGVFKLPVTVNDPLTGS